MIELKNLTKRYGNFTAVDDLSLSIDSGGITGLLGPNGAGKTTTMRMITGYFPPSAGKVIVDGIDISVKPVAVKKKTGYLPESAPVYGDMLVYDYLKYIASLHSIENPGRIDETSSMCGLLNVMGKKIANLSKGYKQRVGLAHALIHDPQILILDEPTNGLDPNQIIEIRNLIKEIGKKKTVLLSTHILSEVEASCDRVIIINKGKRRCMIFGVENTLDRIDIIFCNQLSTLTFKCRIIRKVNAWLDFKGINLPIFFNHRQALSRCRH